MAEAALAESRALIYRFLALGFSFPDTEILRSLQDEAVGESLLAAVRFSPEAESAVVRLQAVAESLAEVGQNTLPLQIEYTRLFINAVPKVPVPPYESVHLGRGRVMGDPASEVLAAYAQAGLSMSQEWREPPDHIAAELEFVSYLFDKQAQALTAGEDVDAARWQGEAVRFMTAHLWRWLPIVADRVQADARHPFYSALADFAAAWVACERALLGSAES
jgi:DMSO reductase family type II enzyme chaperone